MLLTFQKAILAAFAVLACLYLLHSTTSPPSLARRKIDVSAEQASQSTTPGPVASQQPSTVTQPVLNEEEHTQQSASSRRYSASELEELRTHPLRERLKEVFEYSPRNKFPAYIWQTWRVTPASGFFGEENRPREASWTEHHPTFVHHVIDDATVLPLLNHLYAPFPEVIEAYKSLPPALPVLRADFFRYLILLARGGIYSDIDTHVIQPVVRWLPADWDMSRIGLVVGIEADAADRPDWAQWYSRAVQFCQWTILSKKGHPVLRDIVANITQEVLLMKQRHSQTLVEISEGDDTGATFEILRAEDVDKSVVELTGPAVWTDAIYRHLNSDEVWGVGNEHRLTLTAQDFTGLRAQKRVGDVVVLPITSFSPGVGQMGAEDESDAMAFVKHDFEGSWKPPSEQMKMADSQVTLTDGQSQSPDTDFADGAALEGEAAAQR